MNKSSVVAIIAIVAGVAVGAAVFIATGTNNQQTTTAQSTGSAEPDVLEGLEKEQSGEGVVGAQPSDTATSNEETPSPDTSQFMGDTGTAGTNATDSDAASGNQTVTGGNTGYAAGPDPSVSAPMESDFPDQ